MARKAKMMSIGPVVNDGSHHPAGFCGSGSAATDYLKSYSNEDFVPDDEDEAGCYCGSDDEDEDYDDEVRCLSEERGREGGRKRRSSMIIAHSHAD